MPRASDARADLEKKLYGALSGAPSKFSAAGPDPAMYGVFAPQYANAMVARTNPEQGAGGAAAMLEALSVGADNEAARYEQQLRDTRAAQLAGIDREGYYKLQELALGKAPEGLHGQYGVFTGPDGRSSFQQDPVLQSTANAGILDTISSDNIATRAGAIEKAANAGLRPDAAEATQFLRSFLDPQGSEVQYKPYVSHRDQTARYGMDEGMTVEEQFAFEEAKQSYRAKYGTDPDEDGVEWSLEINPHNGEQYWKAKGGRGALSGEGYGPPGNPKAGAQGGGASATPAASDFFTPSRITSKPGPRRAPTAGASTNHKGTDYAYPEGTRIPALQDGEVVSSQFVKGYGNQVRVRYADGTEESYSHNRQNLLKPGDKFKQGQPLALVGKTGTATGPHVHREIHAAARTVPTPADPNAALTAKINKLRNHPNVADVAIANGQIVVKLKDGSTRTRPLGGGE